MEVICETYFEKLKTREIPVLIDCTKPDAISGIVECDTRNDDKIEFPRTDLQSFGRFQKPKSSGFQFAQGADPCMLENTCS